MIGEIINNLGVTWPQWLLIVTVLADVIVIALDLRIALILLFLATGCEMLIAGALGMDTLIFQMAVLTSFALMVISLMIGHVHQQEVR